jgi:hypothetical protein
LPLVYDLAAPTNESARIALVDRVARGERPSEAEVRTIIGASREVRRLEKEEAAKEWERRKEETARERESRSHLSPRAKRRVTLAQKRTAAESMRNQQDLERDRRTAQEATELLLSLLPEADLRRVASLFNSAGGLPGHFSETFFGALKNRLRDLGWNGNARQLLPLNVTHSTKRILGRPL